MHCQGKSTLEPLGRIVIRLRDRLLCTGCGACVNACPKGCISMQEDKEGFLVPAIDNTRCVACGKCAAVCARVASASLNPRPKTAIAAWAKDSEIRMRSSSGGIFSVLANKTLKNGGVINGVSFDREFSLVHRIIDSEDLLWQIRGSRYVQSNVGRAYVEIKQLLDSGMKVLFTSTPCQVAGLKGYLGREYANLVTCDFVCHGVPSSRYFHDYLRSKKREAGREDIVDYVFRDLKGWGWNPSLVFSDGTSMKYSAYSDQYMLPFLAGMNYRESCYRCSFARPERCADITIGDFWSVKDYSLLTNKYEKGCSLVLLNTPKGEKLFDDVAHECKMEKFAFFTTAGNDQLWHPSKRPLCRDMFYQDAKNLTLDEFLLKYGIYEKPRHPLHCVADAARWVLRKLRALKYILQVKFGIIRV